MLWASSAEGVASVSFDDGRIRFAYTCHVSDVQFYNWLTSIVPADDIVGYRAASPRPSVKDALHLLIKTVGSGDPEDLLELEHFGLGEVDCSVKIGTVHFEDFPSAWLAKLFPATLYRYKFTMSRAQLRSALKEVS